ncbi:hypothetical protein MMC25_005737 [Agyrium rufum]|nr:hypothetical protein [Agyrium rufum]
MAFAEDHSDAGIIIDNVPPLKAAKALIRGSWNAWILDSLQSDAQDTVLYKTRFSAFFQTDLYKQLKAQSVDLVIATSVGTSVCVESIVRDAWAHKFRALTVSNAAATLSEEE